MGSDGAFIMRHASPAYFLLREPEVGVSIYYTWVMTDE